MSFIQTYQNDAVYPFLINTAPVMVAENESIAADASRTAALAQYTVMAYNPTTAKWVPWSSVTASDGTAYPAGILMNDGGFTAAQVVAGVTGGVAILVGGSGLRIDSSQLVFDTGVGGGNVALSLATVISSNAAGSGSATPYATVTAEKWLRNLGLYMQNVVVEDLAEN
jgi:hypothetical protein